MENGNYYRHLNISGEDCQAAVSDCLDRYNPVGSLKIIIDDLRERLSCALQNGGETAHFHEEEDARLVLASVMNRLNFDMGTIARQLNPNYRDETWQEKIAEVEERRSVLAPLLTQALAETDYLQKALPLQDQELLLKLGLFDLVTTEQAMDIVLRTEETGGLQPTYYLANYFMSLQPKAVAANQ